MQPNEHTYWWMQPSKIYKLDAVSGCKVQVFGGCMPWCIRFRICSMALSASLLYDSAIADPHRCITVSLIGCTGKHLACNWSKWSWMHVRLRNVEENFTYILLGWLNRLFDGIYFPLSHWHVSPGHLFHLFLKLHTTFYKSLKWW